MSAEQITRIKKLKTQCGTWATARYCAKIGIPLDTALQLLARG